MNLRRIFEIILGSKKLKRTHRKVIYIWQTFFSLKMLPGTTFIIIITFTFNKQNLKKSRAVLVANSSAAQLSLVFGAIRCVYPCGSSPIIIDWAVGRSNWNVADIIRGWRQQSHIRISTLACECQDKSNNCISVRRHNSSIRQSFLPK